MDKDTAEHMLVCWHLEQTESKVMVRAGHKQASLTLDVFKHPQFWGGGDGLKVFRELGWSGDPAKSLLNPSKPANPFSFALQVSQISHHHD